MTKDVTNLPELDVFFQMPSKPIRKAIITKLRHGYQVHYWISANSFRIETVKTRQEAKALIAQSGIEQTLK